MATHTSHVQLPLPERAVGEPRRESVLSSLPNYDRTLTSLATSDAGEDRLEATQERGRKLLQSWRQKSSAPHYTANQVAMLQQRRDQLLRERQNQRENTYAEPDVASNTSRSQHFDSSEYVRRDEVNRMREALIRDFNTHLANCEASNKQRWAEATERHAASLESLTQERDACQMALTQLQQNHTSQCEVLSSLQRELEQSRSALEEICTRCKALEQENSQLKDTLASEKQTLEEVRREADASRAECAQTTNALAEARQELEKLKEQTTNQVFELEHALEEARKTAANLESDRAQLKELLDQEKNEISKLVVEIKSLEEKAKLLPEQIASMTTTTTTTKPTTPTTNPFAGFTNEVEASAEDVVITAPANATSTAIFPQGSERRAVDEELERANLLITELRARLKMMESELDQSQTARSLLVEEVDKMKEQLKVERVERERLAEKLSFQHGLFESAPEYHQTCVETTAVINVPLAANPFSTFDDHIGGGSKALLTPDTHRASLFEPSSSQRSYPQVPLLEDEATIKGVLADEEKNNSHSDLQAAHFLTNAHDRTTIGNCGASLSRRRRQSNPFAAFDTSEDKQHWDSYSHELHEGDNPYSEARDSFAAVESFAMALSEPANKQDEIRSSGAFSHLQEHAHKEEDKRQPRATEAVQTVSLKELLDGSIVEDREVEMLCEVENPWQRMANAQEDLDFFLADPPSSCPVSTPERTPKTEKFQRPPSNRRASALINVLPPSINGLLSFDCLDQAQSASLGASRVIPATENRVYELERELQALQRRLAAYECERSQPFLEMEEIGRKYADTQLRLQLAERENAELSLELAKLRHCSSVPNQTKLTNLEGHISKDGNASHDLAPTEVPNVLGAETANTHRLVGFLHSGSLFGPGGAALRTNTSQSAEQEGNYYAASRAHDGGSVGTRLVQSPHLRGVAERQTTLHRSPCLFTNLTEVGVTKIHAHDRDKERAVVKNIEVADGIPDGQGEALGSSIHETRSPNRSMDAATAMEDFGHRYAQAQHELILCEEARTQLECVVLELRARVEELEMQLWESQQDAKATVKAPPSQHFGEVSSQNPFLQVIPPASEVGWTDAMGNPARPDTPSFQALSEQVDPVSSVDIPLAKEFQRQVEELQACHNRELEDLAEKAADEITELEQTYTLRIYILEQELRKVWVKQLQTESQPSKDTFSRSLTAMEEVGENEEQYTGSNMLSLDVFRLREALEAMKSAMERLEIDHEADLQAIAQEIDAKLAENDKIQEKQLEEQRIFYQTRITELENELEKQEYQSLQAEVEEFKSQHHIRMTKLEDALAQKMKELERLTENNSELRELLQHGATVVQAKIDEQREQIIAANQRIEQLNHELSISQHQLAQYVETFKQLKRGDALAHNQILQAVECSQNDKNMGVRSTARLLHEPAKGCQQAQYTSHKFGSDTGLRHDRLTSLPYGSQEVQDITALLSFGPAKYQEAFESLEKRLTDTLRENEELKVSLKEARTQIELLGKNENSDNHNEAAPMDNHASLEHFLQERILQLQSRVQVLTNECSALERAKSTLDTYLNNAVHHNDEKQERIQEQESELESLRHKLFTVQSELVQQTAAYQLLSQELSQVSEGSAELATSYEELQRQAIKHFHSLSIQKHAEELLMEKTLSIPKLLGIYFDAIWNKNIRDIICAKHENIV